MVQSWQRPPRGPLRDSVIKKPGSLADPWPAPPGFSDEQWATFMRDGLLVLEGSVDPDEVARYRGALAECLAEGPGYRATRTHKLGKIVERHRVFEELIDHRRHVGFAYDLYGEQLKMVQSEGFFRPRGGVANEWHFDGPRVVPFKVFSPEIPLKLRIGYWLTDLPQRGMGNFVYIPGSHRPGYTREHVGSDRSPGEVALCVPAGTVTVMNGDIWHRVEENRTDQPRENLFLTYAPSWVTAYYDCDAAWAQTLPRTRRIIMRPYQDEPKSFIRPPADDLPLFLDRDTHFGEDPGTDPRVERHKRRRLTEFEKRRQTGPTL
jgi:Phytanoyl-CoA dioxygenase (PhyH)